MINRKPPSIGVSYRLVSLYDDSATNDMGYSSESICFTFFSGMLSKRSPYIYTLKTIFIIHLSCTQSARRILDYHYGRYFATNLVCHYLLDYAFTCFSFDQLRKIRWTWSNLARIWPLWSQTSLQTDPMINLYIIVLACYGIIYSSSMYIHKYISSSNIHILYWYDSRTSTNFKPLPLQSSMINFGDDISKYSMQSK